MNLYKYTYINNYVFVCLGLTSPFKHLRSYHEGACL